MPQRKRVKRPTLDRTEPIRRWPALFGSQSGTTEPGGLNGAEAETVQPRLNDAVSQTVGIGYRVIDEYIRQGQKTARRLGEGTYGPGAWTQDVQDLGVRMAQYASDFFGAWVQLFELAAKNGTSLGGAAMQPPQGSADPPMRTAAAYPAQRTDGRNDPVVLNVISARPAEIKVLLRADAAPGELVVHALRATERAAPRLEEVSFQKSEPGGPPVLNVRVPADHPAGVYEGLIVDEQTNRPVGTVRVTIGPKKKKTATSPPKRTPGQRRTASQRSSPRSSRASRKSGRSNPSVKRP